MVGMVELIIVAKESSTVRMLMDGGGSLLTRNPQVQLQLQIMNLCLIPMHMV